MIKIISHSSIFVVAKLDVMMIRDGQNHQILVILKLKLSYLGDFKIKHQKHS